MNFTTIPFEGDLTEDQVTNIASWVAALRSGDYNQGRRVLTSIQGDEFCCLGVACQIKEVEIKEGHFIFGEYEAILMPDSDWFRDKYGFQPDRRIALTDQEDRIHLANLNDGYHLSFGKIADVITSVFIKRERVEFEN